MKPTRQREMAAWRNLSEEPGLVGVEAAEPHDLLSANGRIKKAREVIQCSLKAWGLGPGAVRVKSQYLKALGAGPLTSKDRR